MIKNESKDLLIIGIDHGYGNIKTANHCFKTGIIGYESEPLFTKDMLEYVGRFYIIGEGYKIIIIDIKADTGQNCINKFTIRLQLLLLCDIIGYKRR